MHYTSISVVTQPSSDNVRRRPKTAPHHKLLNQSRYTKDARPAFNKLTSQYGANNGWITLDVGKVTQKGETNVQQRKQPSVDQSGNLSHLSRYQRKVKYPMGVIF